LIVGDRSEKLPCAAAHLGHRLDGPGILTIFCQPGFGDVVQGSVEVIASRLVQSAAEDSADEFAGFVDARELLGHAQLCGRVISGANSPRRHDGRDAIPILT
jgi:hypothetical protein